MPKGEEHLYHCRIEQKQFDQTTGERVSVPRLQKFDKKMFDTFLLHNLHQLGYHVDILHDPTEFIKAQKAAKQEQKNNLAAKQEEAIQRRIEEAVAKAMAKKTKKSKKGGQDDND